MQHISATIRFPGRGNQDRQDRAAPNADANGTPCTWTRWIGWLVIKFLSYPGNIHWSLCEGPETQVVWPATDVLRHEIRVRRRGGCEYFTDGIEVAEAMLPVWKNVMPLAIFVPVVEQYEAAIESVGLPLVQNRLGTLTKNFELAGR